MKAKIVKLKNGKFAIRKGWWIFRVYADLDDLKGGSKLGWWDHSHYTWTCRSTPEELKELIENYNPKPIPKELVIETITINTK